MRRLTLVLGVLAALLLTGGTPALAVPPFAVDAQVVDQVGALDNAADDVQDALVSLQQRTGTRLFVVYVSSFDGLDGKTWAQQAFRESGLSDDQVLFAVAVDDGRYGYEAGNAAARADIARAEAGQIRPRLADSDWAGAAEEVAEALGGSPASAPSSSGGGLGGGAVLGIVLAALLLVGGGAYLLTRRRRSGRKQLSADRPAPADPHAGTSTEELNGRASLALLDVDERTRTGQVDLDYARSHYGEEAVAGSGEALAESRGELARAFALRQELDDDIPEDEPTRRRMLTELLRLTDSAGARLRQQGEALDALRERERTAPQAVEDLARRVAALQQRLPEQERRLAGLRERYAPAALAPVVDNVEQAGVRLAAAAQALGAAREELAGGEAGRAVGRLRPAEDAVGQSTTLLDAIDRLAADLRTAEQEVPAARAEVAADLAEARSLAGAGGRGALPAGIARAESELASADAAVRPADGGLPDPLAALRRLEEAGAALRQVLQGVRDAQAQARRVAGVLDQALLTARSSVAAARDFVGARRGAVGAEARTRLAEAQRHLDAGTGLASGDPVAALREAQHADQLAQYALEVAQDDVARWSQRTGYGPGYGPGYGAGWGGAGYGYGRGTGGGLGSGLGWGLGGLVLGGLLFGDHDGGGSYGDDWVAGGGDFGGGGDF